MITKYLFQNRNEQEVNPMFTVRNVLPLLLVVMLLCGLSFGATLITVKSGGGGDYTTISAALEAAKGPNEPNGYDPPYIAKWPITIEVQDSGTYSENLQFPEVNDLTLKAGAGFFPTITVLGGPGGTPPVDTNEYFIDINSPGTTLQGFTINFSGTAYLVDNNSCMVHFKGGKSTIRDCNIFGPATPNNAYSRGIAGAAVIDNVEVSQCRLGVLCDTNNVDPVYGFDYSITNSWIHDNRRFGLILNDCKAVIDNCLIERSGAGFPLDPANIITEGPNSLLLDVLIKNSTIKDMLGIGRNITLATEGKVDINDCILMNDMFDNILIYRGTLNMKRCIIKNTSSNGSCVNLCRSLAPGVPLRGAEVNIDHCSLASSPFSTQWSVYTTDPCSHIAITNSILTGPQGLFESVLINPLYGSFTSNYNDNDCNTPIQNQSVHIVPGENDLLPKQNPFYIQTTNISNDANLITFFALQPYSPVIGKGEFDSNMGAKGVVYGFEKWPADLDGVYGVDVNDLEVFSSNWLDTSNIIPAGPNMPLEDFEDYAAFPDPNWTVKSTWTYASPFPPYTNPDPCYPNQGASTLSLINSVGGGYDSNKAMKWVYDVNEGAAPGMGRFTEILMILPQDVNINIFGGPTTTRFNQLKVMVKRYAGNSPSNETFMYVKFLDNKWDGSTNFSKIDIVYEVIGGSTDVNAGEWIPWNIDLSRMTVVGSGTPLSLTRINGIIFGIRAQRDGPWGLGQGTIDIDKIELVDTYGCTGYPIGDIYLPNGIGDCLVNFRDYVIFANYWLDGK